MTKTLTKQDEAQVPDLIRTPALELTAEDVALPRVHIGQFMSKAVQNKLVDAGQLYYSTGQDDPDPVVLPDAVLFHVLDLKKSKSWSPEPGAPLERFDYGDPDAPAGAWVVYDYIVALPDEDASMPFKLLLTKTGLPAARQLNTTLAKATVPHYSLAFQLSTADRTNQKGKYWIPQVRQVEATGAGVQIAMDLAVMMSSSATEAGSGRADSQPDI